MSRSVLHDRNMLESLPVEESGNFLQSDSSNFIHQVPEKCVVRSDIKGKINFCMYFRKL